jgi:hypothetical protein
VVPLIIVRHSESDVETRNAYLQTDHCYYEASRTQEETERRMQIEQKIGRDREKETSRTQNRKRQREECKPNTRQVETERRKQAEHKAGRDKAFSHGNETTGKSLGSLNNVTSSQLLYLFIYFISFFGLPYLFSFFLSLSSLYFLSYS